MTDRTRPLPGPPQPSRGRVTGTALPLGQRVRVKLVEADIAKRSVSFELVG